MATDANRGSLRNFEKIHPRRPLKRGAKWLCLSQHRRSPKRIQQAIAPTVLNSERCPERRKIGRSTAERRDLRTRLEGLWAEEERERFIRTLREERRDAHAITIQADQVSAPVMPLLWSANGRFLP